MNKPKIQLHFAHANGFPAGSYQQVFKHLPSSISLLAKPQFAHEGGLSGDNNWMSLVDELITFIEANRRQDLPLWLVGHSMGGIVSFKACCQRPDLFAGLIMFDPPLITGIAAPFIRMLKKTNWINKITPASLSAVRKTSWEHNEDVVDYFCAKPLFNNMRRACVEDYVESVTVTTASGKQLAFFADIETKLFQQIPDDLNRYRSMLKCPSHLVLGSNSNVCKPAMYKPFAKHHNMTLHTMEGGHMFPLENPEETAKLLIRVMGLD